MPFLEFRSRINTKSISDCRLWLVNQKRKFSFIFRNAFRRKLKGGRRERVPCAKNIIDSSRADAEVGENYSVDNAWASNIWKLSKAFRLANLVKLFANEIESF